MAPYFDYHCGDCGHVFEDRADSYDKEKKECPHCETKNSSRLPALTAPPRGNFGTVYKKASKASTAVRDEQLQFEFMKNKETKE